MRSHYITKLLLNPKKSVKHFALTKWLVIGGLGSILAGIPAPSAFSQVNAFGDYEARNVIASLNRQQQLYYLEYGEFASNFADVGLGIPSQSPNYNYTVVVGTDPNVPAVTHQAQPLPNRQSFRAVVGGVMLVDIFGDVTTVSLRCLAVLSPLQGGPNGTQSLIFGPDGPKCPAGYQPL